MIIFLFIHNTSCHRLKDRFTVISQKYILMFKSDITVYNFRFYDELALFFSLYIFNAQREKTQIEDRQRKYMIPNKKNLERSLNIISLPY